MTNQETAPLPSTPEPCKLAAELIRHASQLVGEVRGWNQVTRLRYDDLQTEIDRLNRANSAMKARLNGPAAPGDQA